MEKATESINIRVTPTQKETLKRIAEDNGTTPSAVLKTLIDTDGQRLLRQQEKRTISREEYEAQMKLLRALYANTAKLETAINREGVNLNQLIRRVHADDLRLAPIKRQAEEVLKVNKHVIKGLNVFIEVIERYFE